MESAFILLVLIVLVAYTTEALAGFGSMVIALTLGAHLYPIETLVPVLVPLDVMLNAYIVSRHHGHVAWRFFFKRIAPLMGIGLGVGIAVASSLEGRQLRLAFGVMVVLLSAAEISRQLRPYRKGPAAVMGGVTSAVCMTGAGMIHGIYATGGPLLVYAVGRSSLSKSAFRSTLATVWLTFNSVLIASFALRGQLGTAEARKIGTFLPVLVVGVVLGEWGHRRIDERRFRLVVFSLLLIAGASILARQ